MNAQFSPRRQAEAAAAVVATPPPSGQITNTNKSRQHTLGWCRSFNDCMVVNAATPFQPQRQESSAQADVNKQLAEVQREVEKQKELKMLYKMRLERTQTYLRHCLEMAQENNFLDLIIINNRINPSNKQGVMVVDESSPTNLMPPSSQLQQNHSDRLAALQDRAKMDGWLIQHHEIELEEIIAQGSTADVYRGRWRGLDVAVKCIFSEILEPSNENGIGFFVQEIETVCRQRHPYVLRLLGACLEPPDHGWIVTELLSMTLKDWLHGPGSRRRDKQRTVPVKPLSQRLAKALEIAQAMQYLHQQKPMVIHRDLKPTNIFLDEDMHVRVADFGHARFLEPGEKALTGETGTYVYMAPEVLQCLPYDEKCDVFSFGIILNELITCTFPYSETDLGPSKIAMEVAASRLRPRLSENEEGRVEIEEVNEVIQQAWDEDASHRPSFETIACKLRMILGSSLLHE